MNIEHRIWLLAALAIGIAPRLVSAQAEIGGDWTQPGQGAFHSGVGVLDGFMEEDQDRFAGPDTGDYAGLPIKVVDRYKAALYSPDWLSVPEHQCIPHPAPYQDRSPGGLSIVENFDPVTQRLLSYTVTGNYGLLRTIWMDGRPHPSPYVAHTFEGFSTGKWEGNKLVVETTHIKAGWIRRNGVAHTDRAVMKEYYVRHGDFLTVFLSLDDPTYLEEPWVKSTDFKISDKARTKLIEFGGFTNGGTGATFYKCTIADETDVPPGYVPSFMPGKNAQLTQFAERYKLPLEAAFGGAATMYPEYQSKLRQLASAPPQDAFTLLRSGSASVTAPRAATPVTATRRGGRSAAPPVSSQAPNVFSQNVGGQVWVVTVNGQNIVAQIGPEGVLVVDPGRAETAAVALAEVRKLAGDKPIRIIVNTSADAERTGGNALFGAPLAPSKQSAAIYAQENVGLRMAEQGVPGAGLPTDGFRGDVPRPLYFNNEAIDLIYVPAAHSDSDAIVYFRKSDVLVSGKVIENLTYPVINVAQGGTLNGEVSALNQILQITTPSFRAEGGTVVVPAQGQLYDEGDVAEYRDAMTIVRDRMRDALASGKTAEQMRAEKLTQDYDARYGDDAQGPASADSFVKAAVASLQGAPK